jgi:sarcosine oxidase, subunit beta
MTKTYDAIVIGAGIIGCGTAFGLAAAGRRTLVLDKNPAAGYGSTSSSSAIIRTFYSTRDGCALAWEGLHEWRDWSEFLGGSDLGPLARFVECPSLIMQNGEPDGLDAACRHLKELGVPWEHWSLDTLRAKFPTFDTAKFAPPRRADDPDFGMTSGDLTGALYFPDGGYVTDPQLAARNLLAAAEARGAVSQFNSRVGTVRTEAGRVAGVTLENGEVINAPIVVNAAGPYSTQLNRMAGVLDGMTIRTRPLRQEICHLPRPDDLALDGQGLVVLDGDTGGYWRTELDHALTLGGMEPECDPLIWLDDPDALDCNPTQTWTDQAHRQALRLPSLGIPGQASGVVDLYDVSDDWIPIYDQSDLPGFYMAVGTSGNQFKNGPIAGQLMAGLIDYVEDGGDHDATPYQFPLARTGGTLDAAAFSRRRAVTSDSTMGVLG